MIWMIHICGLNCIAGSASPSRASTRSVGTKVWFVDGWAFCRFIMTLIDIDSDSQSLMVVNRSFEARAGRSASRVGSSPCLRSQEETCKEIWEFGGSTPLWGMLLAGYWNRKKLFEPMMCPCTWENLVNTPIQLQSGCLQKDKPAAKGLPNPPIRLCIAALCIFAIWNFRIQLTEDIWSNCWLKWIQMVDFANPQGQSSPKEATKSGFMLETSQ